MPLAGGVYKAARTAPHTVLWNIGAQWKRIRNRIRKVLGWEPNTPLDTGLPVTCNWINTQYEARKKGRRVVECPGF